MSGEFRFWRAAYWREVAGRETIDDIDYVIGEVKVRYHARIMYPGVVRVGVRTTRMGTSSLTMTFEIRSGETVLVSGETVLVMFDRSAGRAMAIDAALRSKLDAFEQA